MVRFALSRGSGRILCREAAPARQAASEGYGSANVVSAYEQTCCLPCARRTEMLERLESTSAQTHSFRRHTPIRYAAGVGRA